jgi:hypothetical protein
VGSEILVYMRLGFEHILDPRGYDHILFVVALTVPYLVREWRAVLVQVTAFTVGHSVTLALATTRVVRLSSAWVEFLIPVTIFVTAVVQIVRARGRTDRAREAVPESVGAEVERTTGRSLASPATWGLALGFGLIHGLGFSNFLRALLGEEASLFLPLLSFNVGLELGQLTIVAAMLALTTLAVRLGLDRVRRVTAVAGVVGGVAFVLSILRLPTG